jgi:hypothetical protein
MGSGKIFKLSKTQTCMHMINQKTQIIQLEEKFKKQIKTYQ